MDQKPASRTSQQNATLSYPHHMLEPEDLLDFLELPQFTKRWEKLGLDVELDLLMAQTCIMSSPKGAPVIAGTDGLRKLRFAPARWKTGKSGAARILYVYFEEFSLVLLCVVYAKNEIGTISEKVKEILNQTIAGIEKDLHRRKSIRLSKLQNCEDRDERHQQN